jgi:hypothetical protein
MSTFDTILNWAENQNEARIETGYGNDCEDWTRDGRETAECRFYREKAETESRRHQPDMAWKWQSRARLEQIKIRGLPMWVRPAYLAPDFRRIRISSPVAILANGPCLPQAALMHDARGG